MRSGETEAEAAVPGHIFLSYAREERDWALKIIALLEGAGLKVWWDGLLEGGENFLPTTEAALESADCVLVLWSRNATESHWVRDEAQSGRERQCLVPVSLDGALPPLGFRQFQTIDASRWTGKPGSAEAGQILAAVRIRCGARPEQIQPTQAVAPRFDVTRRGVATSGVALIGAGALAAVGFRFWPRGDGDDTVSLAVTPFKNLSGDPEQVWFSGGLSNELRAALARNPRLRVSAPTSSAAADEASGDEFALGRQLGVANLLRGSVQLAGGVVRVSAELAQVKDGLIRWAESFDRKFEDVLAIQSDIASAVAASLVAQIAGADEVKASLLEQESVGGTANPAAYEAYLRGRALYDGSSSEAEDRAALAQFDAALAEDPAFAAAHALRSKVFSAIAGSTAQAGAVQRLYDEAIAAAQRAIDVEPKLADGHLAKGFALNYGRLDRQSAKPFYDQARMLAPGDANVLRAVATFLAYGSEISAAQELIGRVLLLDPLNARAFSSAGDIALFARQYDATISYVKKALELTPKLASAYYAMGNGQYLLGEVKPALESYRAENIRLYSLTGQAIAQQRLNDTQAAQAALNEIVGTYGDASLYQQAQIRAQWGETQSALRLLDKAVAARDPGLLFLPNDPMLDPVRSATGFSRLQSIFAP